MEASEVDQFVELLALPAAPADEEELERLTASPQALRRLDDREVILAWLMRADDEDDRPVAYAECLPCLGDRLRGDHGGLDGELVRGDLRPPKTL